MKLILLRSLCPPVQMPTPVPLSLDRTRAVNKPQISRHEQQFSRRRLSPTAGFVTIIDPSSCFNSTPQSYLEQFFMASYFPDIDKVRYEGPQSKNPLAFRWYNPDEIVEGKSMRDHFRF